MFALVFAAIVLLSPLHAVDIGLASGKFKTGLGRILLSSRSTCSAARRGDWKHQEIVPRVFFGVGAGFIFDNCMGYHDPSFTISCDDDEDTNPSNSIEFFTESSGHLVNCDYTSLRGNEIECRPVDWDPDLPNQRSLLTVLFLCNSGIGRKATAYMPAPENITCPAPTSAASQFIDLSYQQAGAGDAVFRAFECEQGTYDDGLCSDFQTSAFSSPDATACILPELSPLRVSVDADATAPPVTSQPSASPVTGADATGMEAFLPGEEFRTEYSFAALVSLYECFGYGDPLVEISCGDENILILAEESLENTVDCVSVSRSISKCRTTLWDPTAISQRVSVSGGFTCSGDDALYQSSSVRLSAVSSIQCSLDISNTATHAVTLNWRNSSSDPWMSVSGCDAGTEFNSNCVDAKTCAGQGPIDRTCSTLLSEVKVAHAPLSSLLDAVDVPTISPTPKSQGLVNTNSPTYSASDAEATNSSSLSSCDWEPHGPQFVGAPPQDFEFGTYLGMSDDGKTLLLGSPRGARVFRMKDNNSWDQIGTLISKIFVNGDAVIGATISGDGKTVAIGFAHNIYVGLKEALASIQVYRITDSSNLELQGSDIVADEKGDWFGYAVKLSYDGRTIAVGAPFGIVDSVEKGYLCVYELIEYDAINRWENKGNCLYGNLPGGRYGFSVDLSSSGTMLSVGVPRDSERGDNTGKVEVYVFDSSDNAWRQLGRDIRTSGEDPYSFGFVTKLASDGYTIAIGSNDFSAAQRGYVWVYTFDRDSGEWKQKGSTLAGASDGAKFGSALAISSNATALLVGAHGFDRNRGKALFYKFAQSDWYRMGNDIIGEDIEDYLGYGQVAMSADGSSILVGSVGGDHSCGKDCGHAQVYGLVNASSCQPEVTPPGEQTLSSGEQTPWAVFIPVIAVMALVIICGLSWLFLRRPLSRLWWLWPGFRHIVKPTTFFISHRGPDTKDRLAKPLAYILENLDHSVFLDSHTMEMGREIYDDIAKNLYSCKFGVVIISEAFLDSPWCQKELKTLYCLHKAQKCQLIVLYESRWLYNQKIFLRLRNCISVVRAEGQLDRDYLLNVMVPLLDAVQNNDTTTVDSLAEPREVVEQQQAAQTTDLSFEMNEDRRAHYATLLDQYLRNLRSTLDAAPPVSILFCPKLFMPET